MSGCGLVLGVGIGGGGGGASAPLTLASGTITADAPALTLTQTWDNGAVGFVGCLISIAQSASASTSLMLKVENATSGRYAGVDRDGNLAVTKPSVGANVGDVFTVQLGHVNNRLFSQWGRTYIVGNGTPWGFGSSLKCATAASALTVSFGDAHASSGGTREIMAADNRGGNSGHGLSLKLRGQNGGSGSADGTGGALYLCGGWSLGTGRAGDVFLDGGEAQGTGADGDVIVGATRGGLDVRGPVGFYGTAPIAQQTGVAVSAAGIHAALVNLGLITA